MFRYVYIPVIFYINRQGQCQISYKEKEGCFEQKRQTAPGKVKLSKYYLFKINQNIVIKSCTQKVASFDNLHLQRSSNNVSTNKGNPQTKLNLKYKRRTDEDQKQRIKKYSQKMEHIKTLLKTRMNLCSEQVSSLKSFHVKIAITIHLLDLGNIYIIISCFFSFLISHDIKNKDAIFFRILRCFQLIC